jgi:hypothetical protein
VNRAGQGSPYGQYTKTQMPADSKSVLFDSNKELCPD